MRCGEIRGVLFDNDGALFDFAATWRVATRALLALLAPGEVARQRAPGLAAGFDPATGRFEPGSALVAGMALGVATNDAEDSARNHLAAVGALDRFDVIAGYDSGHGHKPGPGMVLAFAAHVGLDPRAVAMVGDSAHDMDAARAAGAMAVAMLSDPATEADLAPLADVVPPSIIEPPSSLAEHVRR